MSVAEDLIQDGLDHDAIYGRDDDDLAVTREGEEVPTDGIQSTIHGQEGRQESRFGSEEEADERRGRQTGQGHDGEEGHVEVQAEGRNGLTLTPESEDEDEEDDDADDDQIGDDDDDDSDDDDDDDDEEEDEDDE